MKKLISFVLCMALCLGATSTLFACGEVDNETRTVIKYEVQDGGIGRVWADNLARDFMEFAKDKEYEPGKKGVKVEILQGGISTGQITKQATAGWHMCSDEASGSFVQDYIAQGYSAKVTDVIKETLPGEEKSIEDKIPEADRKHYQDANGDYYGFPGLAYSAGVTIDENCFDEKGYWLALDGVGKKWDSPITGKTFYFVEGTGELQPKAEDVVENPDKSYGPDGEPGTRDDGMPATLEELIALCEFIKNDGVAPFATMGGNNQNYVAFIYQALCNNLLGAQQLSNLFDFDGKLEVVVGYENEPLFPGYEHGTIKKPKTAIVEVTEETGFYTTWSVASYYAHAFSEMLYKEGWLSDKTMSANYSQKNAMTDFFLSGFDDNVNRFAMLIEMTFWRNESKLPGCGAPQLWESRYNNDGLSDRPRRMVWMSLPTTFAGEEYDSTIKDTTRQTMQQQRQSVLLIAKRVETDPALAGVFEACKDFYQFLYTEAQLNKYTEEIGLKLSVDYELEKGTFDNLSYFNKNLLEHQEENVDFVAEFSSSPAFNAHPQRAVMAYWGERVGGSGWVSSTSGSKTNGYGDKGDFATFTYIFQYYNDNKAKNTCSATSVFESAMISKDAWDSQTGSDSVSSAYYNDGTKDVKFSGAIFNTAING